MKVIQKALRAQDPNEVRRCECGAYFSCRKFIRKDKCDKCEAVEALCRLRRSYEGSGN